MSMPHQIQRLTETVVNRIAAGEVIQRPSAAIKELLENSIDAGASRITIVMGNSGLKFMSITDNGHGIRSDDFPIVCERFTTSKLREYKDLESIRTFGFRGEALASISHVAHMTIISKTSEAATAYKASFLDGKMCEAQPAPCAGLQGTQIVVEDLFYNIPMRLNALKNLLDEYNRSVTALTYFAVHFDTIGFTLKKQARQRSDINTAGKGSRKDVIRSLFGQPVATELIPLSGSESNSRYTLDIDGLITSPNYSGKSLVFMLFVNNRLVECSSIRKRVEAIYATYLPKGAHPFVYFHVQVAPHTVDVNVHPTKREVGLLHETEIGDHLEQWLHSSLSTVNSSRTFSVLTIAADATPQAGAEEDHFRKLATKESLTKTTPSRIQQAASSQSSTPFVTPSRAIRTDHLNPAGRLSAYLQHPNMKTLSNSTPRTPAVATSQKSCNLTSVQNLLDQIESQSSSVFQSLFKEHVFVGCIDDHLSLIQHNTKLYLVNVQAISNFLVYEQCFRNFGAHRRYRLRADPAVTILGLCQLALNDANSGWKAEDGDRDEIARHISELFTDQREMLKEYFSIVISGTGELLALPQIIPKYVPPLAMLPMFILRCGSEVDWKTEERCFNGIARELGLLYQTNPGMYLNPTVDETQPSLQWTIEHIIFSATRTAFHPPKSFFSNGSVIEIASCENLYKVFERC
uniref:DNA mismatch repair protein S5 domain-containing protein n=1 Tax=Spongospora subterranea TaxID=70186 RepID=A0A0H5R1G2_9EUKA|eukprot:CRZ01649.1 hypothetical protein [Spongospora subterranea]